MLPFVEGVAVLQPRAGEHRLTHRNAVLFEPADHADVRDPLALPPPNATPTVGRRTRVTTREAGGTAVAAAARAAGRCKGAAHAVATIRTAHRSDGGIRVPDRT